MTLTGLDTVPLMKVRDHVVFIDDNVDFLEALALRVPPNWEASFHTVRETLYEVLQASRLAAETEQCDLFDLVRIQRDGPDHTDAVSRAFEFLSDPRRVGVVGLLVADYAMPGATGLEICQAAGGQPGLQRLLLTGIASERDAIQGFNSGAIDQFVPKHVEWLKHRLVSELDRQLRLSVRKRSEVLQRSLSPLAKRILAPDSVQKGLAELFDQHGIVEYVYVNTALGFACLDNQAQGAWIQLESDETLPAYAELRDDDPDRWPADLVERIAAGRAVVNEYASMPLGLDRQEAAPVVLCENPRVLAGVFRLDLPEELRPAKPVPLQRRVN